MEELKCPICNTQYSDLNPPRILTMCGHTFCHQCIRNMIKRKEYRYQIKCPEDKIKLSLESRTPSQFPRNMLLVEAMNKHYKNEFLLEVSSQRSVEKIKVSPRDSKKNSLSLSLSSILDETRCLLHQKPLDIICLEEKIHICAQCALFGVHKGHACTTIKDLEAKRTEWIHQLAQVMEERKQLHEEMNENAVSNSFNSLLENKKTELFDQIKTHFTALKRILQQRELELKQQIQKELNIFQAKMSSNLEIFSKKQDLINQWEKQVLNSMAYLQVDDVTKQIGFFAEMLQSNEQNLINKGRNILNELKKERQSYWKVLLSNLQFPKVSYWQSIQQDLKKAVKLLTFSGQHRQKRQSTDFIQGYSTPQFQDVSLLDIEDNFNQKGNLSTVNDSQNQSNNLIDSSFFPVYSSVQIQPKTIKKAKSKDYLFDSFMPQAIDKRSSFNNPKLRLKTEYLPRGTAPLPSPIFLKNKAKRNLLKVKDPEKFQKILKALEGDNLQIADFTGFEMGDEAAKEVCEKLIKCSKVKSLRLMKNQLTDGILPDLFKAISHLQIINLSQNAFTTKIFQILQQQAKKDKSNVLKYFQLGQNNINPRKCKQRIEELKRFGYLVSL